MKCIHCGSDNIQRRGQRGNKNRYKCSSCGKWFSSFGDLEREKKQPRILFFDIETLPLEVYTWGIYEQHVAHTQIKRDWCLCSWSAKWPNGEMAMHDVLTPEEAVARNDQRVLMSIWKLLDQADIVVAHNGDGFDIPKLRARMLYHRIPNPSYFKSIDTYKIAKSQFRLTCNKLDYLLQYLGYEGKIDTEFELWVKCSEGDPQALEEMVTYNDGDVYKLEEVYMDLLPYITNHPDMGLWTDKTCCPNCGSEKFKEEKKYPGTTYLYDAYRCGQCSALWHSRKRRKKG